MRDKTMLLGRNPRISPTYIFVYNRRQPPRRLQINISRSISRNRDCSSPSVSRRDSTGYSSNLKERDFVSGREHFVKRTTPLRFRTTAIPLLEFHSNDQRPRRMIRRTIILRAHSRVANESILCGCVVYKIIFRTIFFTWPPDCIKKIAYLLCGSVLAWKLTTRVL